ncbi:MAG TPA: heavy metal translocating P-type ATPase metal-binding domain-containing protein [Burkholderiaceae bacterium]|nr:heavy metal translocating P-type ATPase metal-binding domain-containing protein [Burkholderiaceae bacterium]
MPVEPQVRKAKILDDVGTLAATSDAVCAHCGDPLAGLKVFRRLIGGERRSFCCLGCAFIAEQIYLAQASNRDRAALTGALNVRAPGIAIAPPNLARAQLPVQGMVCAACALLVEHRLRREPGVAQAAVDFGAGRAYVAFDPALTSTVRLERVVERAGYRAGAREPGDEKRAQRVELLRVLLAWLVMMQVMMLAVPAYLAGPGDIAPDIQQLLRIAQLVLTVPVLAFSAIPLVRAAVSQVRAGAVGMDLPIVLGLAAAFGASAFATVRAQGPVYFDSIAMFVALVLGVRWVQARALAAASRHVETALRGAQIVAQRLRGYPGSMVTETVAAEALAVGEYVLVPPGETVPADGIVMHGASTVSQAWLTGEATPFELATGGAVSAGAVNLDQPIVLRVERAGDATSLAALRRLVDDAGRARPRVIEVANRVAGAFLWVVLAVTAATVAGWWFIDPARALPSAIAVLVATCPCALALAAPAALAVLQSALARRGVLTARVAAIEQMAHVDTLACDKTGTLTLPVPELVRIVPLRGLDVGTLLARAAALEALSNHPFARALMRAARAGGVALPAVVDGVVAAAAGVEGAIEGKRLRIGRPDYALGLVTREPLPVAARLLKRLEQEKLRAASVVVLADPAGPLALFAFGEACRTGAAALVQEVQAAGVQILLVSGDRREPVERVARELGIGTDVARNVFALQTPESKRQIVTALQAQGRRVAMLGDGLNDAPVIAQADVSIALAEGATLAQARADFIALHSRPADVAAIFAGSRKAMRIVRQNLLWAVGYNIVIIPLAALGYLTPALAAVGMAASSLLVVANALRARSPGAVTE